MKRNIFFSFICFLLSHAVQGQSVSVKADKYKVLIGQKINLEFSVVPTAGFDVLWPVLDLDSIAVFEIITKHDIDTVLDEAGIINYYKKKLEVTCFQPGMQRFPSMLFQFRDAKNGQIIDKKTDELLITINTVDVDTTEEIKALKDIMAAPFDIEEWLPWIGLVAAILLLLGLFLLWYFKRVKPQLASAPPKIIVPPYQLLMARLDEIKKEQIWKKGLVKQYYSDITDALRSYIESEWKIRAMELTSDEILFLLASHPDFDEVRNDLKTLFSKSDLVKFAKLNPAELEHIEILALTISIAERLNKQRVGERKKSEGGESV
jgi:hypothetical protein